MLHHAALFLNDVALSWLWWRADAHGPVSGLYALPSLGRRGLAWDIPPLALGVIL